MKSFKKFKLTRYNSSEDENFHETCDNKLKRDFGSDEKKIIKEKKRE